MSSLIKEAPIVPSLALPLKDSEKDYIIAPRVAEMTEKSPYREIEPRRPIKYVIFDLDGTLIDVNRQHRSIFVEHAYRMLGVPRRVSREFYTTVAGRRTSYQVDNLLDRFGFDTDQPIYIPQGKGRYKRRVLTEEYVDKIKSAIYREKSKAKGRKFSQVESMLQELISNGIKVGVSTFSKETDAIAKLRKVGILHFFKIESGSTREYTVVGRDSLGLATNLIKGKPHFELLAYIFEQPYGTFIQEAVLISDTVEDLEEVPAKVRKIGISDAAYNKKQLLDAGADSVRDIKEYGHIPKLVRFL